MVEWNEEKLKQTIHRERETCIVCMHAYTGKKGTHCTIGLLSIFHAVNSFTTGTIAFAQCVTFVMSPNPARPDIKQLILCFEACQCHALTAQAHIQISVIPAMQLSINFMVHHTVISAQMQANGNLYRTISSQIYELYTDGMDERWRTNKKNTAKQTVVPEIPIDMLYSNYVDAMSDWWAMNAVCEMAQKQKLWNKSTIFMLLDVHRLIRVHSNKKCGTSATQETNGTHQKRENEIRKKRTSKEKPEGFIVERFGWHACVRLRRVSSSCW